MLLISLLVYSIVNTIDATPISTPGIPAPTFDSFSTSLNSTLGNDCVCPTGNNERSLADIVWSCLATTFSVTWVAFHPNIPALREKWWWTTWRRLKGMYWALVCPELMLLVAMSQWIGAKEIAEEVRRFASTNELASGRDWSIVHGYYIQMGGFLLSVPKDMRSDNLPTSPEGFHTLTLDDLKSLLQKKRIELPSITQEEIQDKSKSDELGKAIAFLQIFWFITQVIARGVQRLAITHIELTTMALATLNIFMYVIWWNKPFGVQCPTIIHFRNSTPGEKIEETEEGSDREEERILESQSNSPLKHQIDLPPVSFLSKHPSLFFNILKSIWEPVADIIMSMCTTVKSSASEKGIFKTLIQIFFLWPVFQPFDELLGTVKYGENAPHDRVAIFNRWTRSSEHFEGVAMIASIISGSIFGGLHLIGWSFTFPYHVEAILWRSTGCIITASPPILLMALMIMGERPEISVIEWGGIVLFIFLTVAYISARIIILILSVITLHNLPPSAFETVNWLSFIPHI